MAKESVNTSWIDEVARQPSTSKVADEKWPSPIGCNRCLNAATAHLHSAEAMAITVKRRR